MNESQDPQGPKYKKTKRISPTVVILGFTYYNIYKYNNLLIIVVLIQSEKDFFIYNNSQSGVNS